MWFQWFVWQTNRRQTKTKKKHFLWLILTPILWCDLIWFNLYLMPFGYLGVHESVCVAHNRFDFMIILIIALLKSSNVYAIIELALFIRCGSLSMHFKFFLYFNFIRHQQSHKKEINANLNAIKRWHFVSANRSTMSPDTRNVSMCVCVRTAFVFASFEIIHEVFDVMQWLWHFCVLAAR